jgi:hypothetical protein
MPFGRPRIDLAGTRVAAVRGVTWLVVRRDRADPYKWLVKCEACGLKRLTQSGHFDQLRCWTCCPRAAPTKCGPKVGTPAECRKRVLALIRSGKSDSEVAKLTGYTRQGVGQVRRRELN